LQKWIAEMKNGTDGNPLTDAEVRAVARAETCAVVYAGRKLRKDQLAEIGATIK
jgi:hypothetical protein